MKNLLLTLFLLVSFTVSSQVFNYTKITDLKTECVCRARVELTDSTMSITHDDSTKTFKIVKKETPRPGLYIIHINDYKVKIDIVESELGLSYTGNSNKLKNLNIPLNGLTNGIYECYKSCV